MNNNFTINDANILVIENFFNTIDFPLLREQKEELLYDAEEFELDVSGIIHLIDALQDAAVAAGIPESTVFGELANDE